MEHRQTMSDEEEQSDELLALVSIYGNETVVVSTESKPFKGKFVVNVDLTLPFCIFSTSNAEVQSSVEYLPPIILAFTLPSDYPSVNPPIFKLTCPWLTEEKVGRLSRELDLLWQNSFNSVILFTWFNFLQTESVIFLNIVSPLCLNNEQFAAVIENDRLKREQDFMLSSFTCQVCFSEKSGSGCLRFYNCGHVFCKSCMKDYFEMHIKDGTVQMLKCVAEKCKSDVHPSQVKELVSAELFDRYDRLLLQSSLDTMNDVVYCPRKACGLPVLVDREGAMGTCDSCHYVFCIYCKMVYHGIEKCRVKTEELKKLRNVYLSADDEGKREMEQRYGKKVIRHLVEELFSEEWMEQNSKKCPRCSTQIQKIDGCNKMACTKCQCFFCWLCLKVITDSNPYSHFNNQSSACFNQLFRGVVVDDERDGDDDDDFFNFL